MARRTPLAAAVAVVLAGAVAPVAGAAQVTIVPPRADPVTLTTEQLEAAIDVPNRTYTVGGRPRTLSGVSLSGLIAAADVDPVFSYAEIRRASGQPLRLSREQTESEGAFPEGRPVVYWDAQGTYFLRPGGADGDDGEVIAGSDITIGLRSGPLLEVEIEASRTRVEPGEKVTFTARVERAGAGQQLGYSWSLDGGGPAMEGPRITHAFDKPGSYDVVVGVTAAGDATGDDDVVTIRVGKLSTKGPDRKGGGENDDTDAPDSGAAGGSSGSSGAQSTSTPATTASPPDAQPRQGAEDERDRARPAATAAVVSGKLLAGVARSPRSRLAEALRSALRTGSPSRASDGLDVPAVAWSIAATLGLLGFGAGLELRQARRRQG